MQRLDSHNCIKACDRTNLSVFYFCRVEILLCCFNGWNKCEGKDPSTLSGNMGDSGVCCMPRTHIHREIYGLFSRLPRLRVGSVVIPVVSHRVKLIAFNFMPIWNRNAESSSQRVSGLPISWASSLLASPVRVLTWPMVVCLIRYKKVSTGKVEAAGQNFNWHIGQGPDCPPSPATCFSDLKQS